MTNFSINGQDWLINDILDHLKNGIIGIAIAEAYDYKVIGETINFTLKPNKEVNPSLLFWFGFHTK